MSNVADDNAPVTQWAQTAAAVLSHVEDAEKRAYFRGMFEEGAASRMARGKNVEEAERLSLHEMRLALNRANAK